MTRRQRLALSFLMVASIGSLACHKTAPAAPPQETYAPSAGAVGLEIIPMGNADGAPRWLATFSDGTTTTKFQIEINRAPAANRTLLASGKGHFFSVPESDPTPLLNALRQVLQAKRRPNSAQKVDDLPFEYSLLGDNQMRSSDGSFSGGGRGNWTTTKIFLANDQAEVYFNFNPVIHKAEFAIKDRQYGDRLLGEFAKVF